MVMLPTTLPQIRAMIEESRAMLRSSRSMLRQARYDTAAAFVAALYAVRNAERETAVLRDGVLPKARQAVEATRQAYATGGASFTDLIDAQRMLLDVQRMLADAAAEREKRLAEMEQLAGVDVEALGATGGSPVVMNTNGNTGEPPVPQQ
jgi:outer membrane protein TolC